MGTSIYVIFPTIAWTVLGGDSWIERCVAAGHPKFRLTGKSPASPFELNQEPRFFGSKPSIDYFPGDPAEPHLFGRRRLADQHRAIRDVIEMAECILNGFEAAKKSARRPAREHAVEEIAGVPQLLGCDAGPMPFGHRIK